VKRLLLIFGICFVLASATEVSCGQAPGGIKKVVIDAGHGGKDPGALGKHSREKDIVLSVALKTGHFIESNFPDVEVIYTRKEDVFVELHKRAQIANESGADVFISIHCNSNKSSSPYGAETYVMGLHKTEENLDVAKTENAAIYYEEDYTVQYDGFNPDSDEDYIVLSMFQSANIEQSIDFSKKVQDHFHERVGRKNRGVKQAGFWVLYKTTMPGILIELGFLSNPEEEKYLMSESGQEYLASAIFEAFSQFKSEFEENNQELKPIVVKKPQPVQQVYYRIQFASYNKEKSLDFRKFRGLEDIRVYKHNGQFKYTTGNFTSLEEAQKRKNELKNNGYKDSFIVAFLNEERITLEKAREISDDHTVDLQ
jgi:N-acetylmuramoyl-L-alanine amidase